MEPRIYYNENNAEAANWLRVLMMFGALPFGDVDTRSIADVQPADLHGYDQVHLFAGIGGWAYAAKLAGWPAHKQLWTGSCPCQPYSAAGKRKGRDDERNLWPEMHRLVAACRPVVVAGEQVASKDGRLWLSGVRLDLEVLDFGVWSADLCAAGVEAPHIRQRLYWLADTASARWPVQPGGAWWSGRAAGAAIWTITRCWRDGHRRWRALRRRRTTTKRATRTAADGR